MCSRCRGNGNEEDGSFCRASVESKQLVAKKLFTTTEGEDVNEFPLSLSLYPL